MFGDLFDTVQLILKSVGKTLPYIDNLKKGNTNFMNVLKITRSIFPTINAYKQWQTSCYDNPLNGLNQFGMLQKLWARHGPYYYFENHQNTS